MMIEIGGEIFDTAGQDVVFSTTLLTDAVTINTQDIQPAPQSTIVNSDGSITLTWQFNKIIMGQTLNLPVTFNGSNLISDTSIQLTKDTSLAYLDRNNNPISENLDDLFIPVNKYRMDSSVTLDKTTCRPGEEIAVKIITTNLTDYDCTLTGSVQVQDASGTLVQNIADETDISWAPGESKEFHYLWTSGNYIAGPYQVTVIWREANKEISSASAALQLENDGGITIQTTTDKISYTANETVHISSKVNNSSNNTIYRNLTVSTQIRNGSNETVWQTEQPINELLPGALAPLACSWPVEQNPAGDYSIYTAVYEGSNLLCSDDTAFTILSSQSSGIGISGKIQADPKNIYPLDDVSINWQLTNTGNTAINELPTRIRIVNPATEEVLDTISVNVSLAIGESRSDSVTWTHPVLLPANYMLVYDALPPDGSALPLSSGAIVVKKPFTVQVSQTVRPRVLVWSICRPNVEMARACLDEMQVYYHIVNNRFDFVEAMQSGQFNTYIILDNLVPLLPCEDQMLAGEIASGKGLIAASYFNGDNLKNLGLFGASFEGLNLILPYRVDFPSGSAFEQSTINGLGLTQRLALTAGQQEAELKILRNSSPAIVNNQYEQGKTMLFAFDFRDIDKASAADLLRQAMELTCPQEDAGNVREIAIQVNAGMSTQAKIANLLPADSTILWAQPAPGNDSAIWEFDITAGEEKLIRFVLELPEDSPDALLTTQSYFMVEDSYYLFDETTTSLALP